MERKYVLVWRDRGLQAAVFDSKEDAEQEQQAFLVEDEAKDRKPRKTEIVVADYFGKGA